jgi:hypothetical protein
VGGTDADGRSLGRHVDSDNIKVSVVTLSGGCDKKAMARKRSGRCEHQLT